MSRHRAPGARVHAVLVVGAGIVVCAALCVLAFARPAVVHVPGRTVTVQTPGPTVTISYLIVRTERARP